MPRNKKDQLVFDETIYAQPVSGNSAPSAPEPKPAKPKIKLKTKPVVPASLQPFLPGLSRRGRPRSKNPIPATVRATESRKRRIEAGTKRIELLVAPGIATDIDLLCSHFRVSRVEIISRLVAKAAKRIRLTTTA